MLIIRMSVVVEQNTEPTTPFINFLDKQMSANE